MTDQKYCRNCGAPNPPDARFCSNCSNAFVSTAASPPPTAPSAAPTPLSQQPPYSPAPEPTIFGVSRKMVVIGVVALFVLLTLGCIAVAVMTPNTSTPTPAVEATIAGKAAATTTATRTPTATPTSSSDKSSYITSQFSDADYIVVTPFTKSTNSYGNVVYTGVVKDSPEKKLNPYSHKITIELTKDNSTTKTRYAQYKTQLLSSGLVKEFDYGDYMTFYDGSTYTNPPREAYLDMNEPSLINHIYNTGVYLNLGNTFMVTLDDTTKI